MNRIKLYTLTFGLALTAASSVHAQSVNQRLDAIDQQQKIIERKWELQEEKAKDTAQATAGKDGFTIKTGDGSFLLKLRGLVHADGRFFAGGQPQNLGVNTFIARRVRPTIEGSVFNFADFKITPDFGNGVAIVQDAYVDLKFLPELKLRGGKFKEPFGIERLQSANNLLFIERGLPNNLVPNRDLGFQLFGDLASGIVNYAVGVFNGVVDGGNSDLDNNDGKDVAARFFFKPFLKSEVDALQGLGLGVAGTFGKQKTNLPSFRTPGQQVFFSYLTAAPNSVVAAGKVARISPQTYYSWGPFGLLGEYVRSSQRVASGAIRDTLTHQAWQGAVSYVLTGEKASYKGVKPKQAFNPKKGTWGAVELASRYNELRIDPSAFTNFASISASARQARAFGGGVNWYLNDNVKLVGNYERTTFVGGAAAGANRRPENVIGTRLELAF